MVLPGTLTVLLGGNNIIVDYAVFQNNAAEAHFNYLGSDYSFSLTRWKQKAFSQFRSKFHAVYDDHDKFGSSCVDTDTGDVISSDNTSEQNKQVVVKSIEDIFLYLDTLLHQHPRSILDYAVWYREKHCDKLDTYEKYIQLVTCHSIVHSDFLAGNIRWDIIKFEPKIEKKKNQDLWHKEKVL
jgi:hypothetical protein